MNNMNNMNNINHTNHSALRCQQRGIPSDVVNFIVKNGDSFRSHEHRKFFINKKKFKKLERCNKEFLSKYDKQIMNTAVVCSQDSKTIITAMKITGSIKWN